MAANNQQSNQVESNVSTNGCEEPTAQPGHLAKQQDIFLDARFFWVEKIFIASNLYIYNVSNSTIQIELDESLVSLAIRENRAAEPGGHFFISAKRPNSTSLVL